jgi:hypothetical protein
VQTVEFISISNFEGAMVCCMWLKYTRKGFFSKYLGKRSFGRPKLECENNIKAGSQGGRL